MLFKKEFHFINEMCFQNDFYLPILIASFLKQENETSWHLIFLSKLFLNSPPPTIHYIYSFILGLQPFGGRESSTQV